MLHRAEAEEGPSSSDSSSIRAGAGVSLSESPKSISDSSFFSFGAFPAADELLRVLVFELERTIPVVLPLGDARIPVALTEELIASSPTVACRRSSMNVHSPSLKSSAICFPVLIRTSWEPRLVADKDTSIRLCGRCSLTDWEETELDAE